jgi:hypothetical protein
MTPFLQREDAHPIAIMRLVVAVCGKGALTWEPKSVYAEMAERGFGQMTRANAQKFNAARAVRGSILPETEWESFEKAVWGLCGTEPSFEIREPCNLQDVAVAVSIISRIKVPEFSLEVRQYIGACALNDELNFLPTVLQFAMPQLCPSMYHCKDCGNTDTDDLEDGQCDVCVGRYEDEKPNGKPTVGLERLGKNIIRGAAYDYTDVADMYRKASTMRGKVTLPEDATGIQVAKLLGCDAAVASAAQQLNLQIEELKNALRR